jgi:S1-C subfamily serine protease
MLNIWRGQKKCFPAVFRYLASGLLCAAIVSGAVSVMAAVTVLTETASDPPAEHQDGDALPKGTRFRVLVAPESSGPLAVDVEWAGRGRERLYSTDSVSAGRPIQLPSAIGWLSSRAGSETATVVVTQQGTRTNHVIHWLDEAVVAAQIDDREAGAPKSPTPGRSPLALGDDLAAVRDRVVSYTVTTAQLAAKPQSLAVRGGAGERVFREASPGVVLIIAGDFIGSGIILSKEGEVLTNWHVVQSAKSVGLVLKPPVGQRIRPTDVYEAHVVKYDEVADLALVQFEHPPPGLVALRLSDDPVEVGSTVHAIGHPAGEYWTYTLGVVSQVRVDYEWTADDKLRHRATVIQTQTPINPGNSGGPLLNDNFAVVGVNSFLQPGKQGLNFAVSAANVKLFLAMKESRHAEKASAPAKPQAKKSAGEKCEMRQYPTFPDPASKKTVQPVDTQCRGWPDLYIVGQRPDGRPEYALVDTMGDKKVDIKIVFNFTGKTDLWIFYANRDSKPTAFGYDYDGKGKPDRVVAISAALQ